MDFRCFSSLYIERSVLINKGIKDNKKRPESRKNCFQVFLIYRDFYLIRICLKYAKYI